MKLLRNPMVVGLLAVAALALVFKNVVWPILRRAPQQARPPAAAAAAPLTPVTAPLRATEQARTLVQQLFEKASAADAALSLAPPTFATKIDSALLRMSSARWAEAPRRDPFQIRHLPVVASGTNAYPPAMELLTLSGIWRQTGGTLAVINKRVFSEGDTILRFTLKNIDADRVWVDGPNGREAVEFKLTLPEQRYVAPQVSEKAPPNVPN